MEKNRSEVVTGLLFVVGAGLCMFILLPVGAVVAFGGGNSIIIIIAFFASIILAIVGMIKILRGLDLKLGIARKDNEKNTKYYFRIVGYFVVAFLLAVLSKYIAVLLYIKFVYEYYLAYLVDLFQILFFFIGWFIYFVIIIKQWPRKKLITYCVINFLVLFIIFPTLTNFGENLLFHNGELPFNIKQDALKKQKEIDRIQGIFINETENFKITFSFSPLDVKIINWVSVDGNTFSTYIATAYPKKPDQLGVVNELIYLTESSGREFSTGEKKELLEHNEYNFTYLRPIINTVDVNNQKIIFTKGLVD